MGKEEKRPDRTGRNGVPAVGLWKMLDNLRQTLLAPATFISLVAGWLLLPRGLALGWTAFILATIAVPIFLPVLFAIVPRRSGITPRSHFGALRDDLRIAFAPLPSDDLPRRSGVADGRRDHQDAGPAVRQPPAPAGMGHGSAGQGRPRLKLGGFYGQMAGGVALGVAAGIAVVAVAGVMPVALPLRAVLWIAAPAIALWTSRSPTSASQLGASKMKPGP